MENVVVSVIIPVYNVEQYLCECIDSVLAQSFWDLEVLLVDDGSTDRSGEICDEYVGRDCRVKVFHKKNGGLSSARNAGIELARGEYVIFLDSDDYWLGCESLGKLVFTAASLNADIVRGEYKEVDEYGEDLLIKDFSNKSDKQNQILSSSEFYKSIINGENFSVLFLFKRRLFAGGLRFDENRSFQEDIDLNIKLFANKLRCAYVQKVFYAYRKRRYSIVTTPKVENLEGSFSLCNVFHRYSNIVSDNNLKAEYSYNSIMMYYWTLETLSQEPYYKDCLSIIEKLSLVSLNKAIRKWAKSTNRIYPLPIYLSPILGVYYFRLRFNIGIVLRKLGII